MLTFFKSEHHKYREKKKNTWETHVRAHMQASTGKRRAHTHTYIYIYTHMHAHESTHARRDMRARAQMRAHICKHLWEAHKRTHTSEKPLEEKKAWKEKQRRENMRKTTQQASRIRHNERKKPGEKGGVGVRGVVLKGTWPQSWIRQTLDWKTSFTS